MCNRYSTPDLEAIEREWEISRRSPNRWWESRTVERVVAPLRVAPYIKFRGELELGQWGMIPANSKESTPKTTQGKRMSTNNARIEGVAKSWTYRFPWSRGQRCLIPADSYDEPYWGTLGPDGKIKNIWWRFERADGRPWALAGLWSEWVNPETGEVVPNFTMLTQNCDGHPLLGLMHKPDPKLPEDKQDKRSVIPIERSDWDVWLHGTLEQAQALVRVPPIEVFRHGAADPAQTVPLPIA